jgi:hypothetical protein
VGAKRACGGSARAGQNRCQLYHLRTDVRLVEADPLRRHLRTQRRIAQTRSAPTLLVGTAARKAA